MEQERLNLYFMSMKYIRDLHKVDDRVQSVSPQIHKSNRPFVGIVVMLVPGDFDHSVTGEKSQKVTRENDQKSHLTPLIIQFPEDCQKQFLPFL